MRRQRTHGPMQGFCGYWASGTALAEVSTRGRVRAVPVQMWQERAQSRRRCGRQMWQGRAQFPARMWQGRAQSQCRCGRGEPSCGADVAGVTPVAAQMWQGSPQSRCRFGRDEPSSGADVAGASPVSVQMWQGRAQARRRQRRYTVVRNSAAQYGTVPAC